MDSEPNQPHDPGFLFSLNLMVLGGALLLFAIITGNKLLIHYLSESFDQSRGILYSINIMEAESFSINSAEELYIIWFAFILSLTGLIITISKLVHTWKT